MRRSEAEELIRMWWLGDGKVFKYVRFLMPDEYVVFRRNEKEYIFDKTSTYKLKDMNEDDFVKMLINADLVYVRDFTYSVNLLHMKTGGCLCGCWILKDNASFHDEKCPLYRR
jgi:hypothetical protein